MRFGLCCIFMNEPIKFRTTTARALAGLSRSEQCARLSAICLENAKSLHAAVLAAHRLGIGAFRVTTPFFPRYTHPEVGYTLDDLPAGDEIRALLLDVNKLRSGLDIRLSFHPDQFVSISSLRDDVVRKSVAELEYQGLLAEMIGADVINIHAGGRQGGKEEALQRFSANFSRLSERVRMRLTLENDDISFTVRDLLPLCRELGIPLVYDVHHHRCNSDGFSVEEATRLAVATWQQQGREPWVHLSSPKDGWQGGRPRLHADYIDPDDFPDCWRGLEITVDVEAKAKELAVLRLMADLRLK
ncbi:MAG: UV DNA damage repair endonuclease UvsE [Geobacteraceae bacterium]|nr:UV DNA damage repair endonuclease UvsE [Geobacteraceae bacterium]